MNQFTHFLSKGSPLFSIFYKQIPVFDIVKNTFAIIHDNDEIIFEIKALIVIINEGDEEDLFFLLFFLDLPLFSFSHHLVWLGLNIF